MRVLLLTPPYIPGFMRNARWDGITISGSEWFPIWLGYCTALLEREKHEVKLVDTQVDRLTHEEVYKLAQDFSPELTVLYYSSKSIENDLAVADRIHDLTGSNIVLVGHSASIDPVGTLKQSSQEHLLARGEFDFTVLDLANGVPNEQIKGLFWKDTKGEVIENPPREPVPAEELDGFPFVTDVYRRHLNITNYHQPCHNHPFVDLFTGRGCAWGKCTFCLWPNTLNKGAGYRTRSIPNVIEELRFISSEMPWIKEVYFQDDTMPKVRAREISEAILDAKLKICWSSYSRANLDYETLKVMRKSGCHLLEVGFESSSAEILKNIQKGTSKNGMEQFAHDALKAGILVIGAFVTGFPGETKETVEATSNWARKLPLMRYTITLPKPYPETPLYQYLDENNCLKNGRPDYPDLPTEEIYCLNKWSLKHVYFSHNYLFKMLTRPSQWHWVAHSAKYFLPYVFSRKKQDDTPSLEW